MAANASIAPKKTLKCTSSDPQIPELELDGLWPNAEECFEAEDSTSLSPGTAAACCTPSE